MPLSPLNEAILAVKRRAEGQDVDTLIATFEDAGPLFAQLSSTDHQVLYGRRGTGKTHALKYLAARRQDAGDLAVYVDLRTLGSTDGLYANTDVPVQDRALRIFIDLLLAVQASLLDQILDAKRKKQWKVDSLVGWLELLAESLYEIRTGMTSKRETVNRDEKSKQSSARAKTEMGTRGVTVGGSLGRDASATSAQEVHVQAEGVSRYRVNFADAGEALRNILAELQSARVWVLIDEWSSLARDIQPYVADMVRRVLLPIQGLTVKFGAIEQRTTFLMRDDGSRVGIELGADVAASIDLDDFMVFGRDQAEATKFMSSLLHKHVKAELVAEGAASIPGVPDEFVRAAFTQADAFKELVRAAEGVPRDAINVAIMAAAAAGESKIGVPDVQRSARKWYQGDKESAVAADTSAEGSSIGRSTR